MRNYWYRQGLAQYLTASELTEVKRRPDLVAERDFAFGKLKEDSDQPEEQVVKVDTKLLSVEIRSHTLANADSLKSPEDQRNSYRLCCQITSRSSGNPYLHPRGPSCSSRKPRSIRKSSLKPSSVQFQRQISCRASRST